MKTKNIKIGLVSAQSFSEPGGAGNHVVALYHEFIKKGYRCKIIVPGKWKPPNVREEDVMPIGVSVHVPANGSQSDMSVSFRRSSREKIRRENFDILHLHNLNLGPLSYQILRKSTALHILTVHVSDDGSTLTKLFPFIKSAFSKIYENKIHGVITVSPIAGMSIDGYYSSGPIATIPNGIDLERFSTESPALSEPGDAKRNILFVGRFEKRKGLMYFLKAADQLVNSRHKNNLRFVIVGDGEEREKAENFVYKKGLSSSVKFVGRVRDDTLPSYYKTADIFCAPSIHGESFGITLLEAMASGTPIVGFSNPGYTWTMRGHETVVGENLLVHPANYMMLAQKIEMLLDNPILYRNARRWGLENCSKFAWPKIANQVLNFYREAGNAQNTKISI